MRKKQPGKQVRKPTMNHETKEINPDFDHIMSVKGFYAQAEKHEQMETREVQ